MFEFPRREEVGEKKIEDASYRKEVLKSLEQIGLHELLDKDIIARLVLLEKGSKFNEYARRIERGMENVLDLLETRYAKDHSGIISSNGQRLDGRRAAILHDIGKSGPVNATPKEQEVIIKIFACENIRNSNLLVSEAVRQNLRADQIKMAQSTLEKHGIGGEVTMREFWDKHAEWTHDILEHYPIGLSERTRIIACSHHIDRGISPCDLPESKIPLPAGIIGNLEEYLEALEGRLLIALDQYEASISRGGLSHEEALSQVRKGMVMRKNDRLMNLVLEAIDELGKDGKIFLSKEGCN